MCTPFQYLLLSDSPEKEENFKRLKKEHGTVFAYHGSPIENWHSILRKARDFLGFLGFRAFFPPNIGSQIEIDIVFLEMHMTPDF